MRYAQVVPFDVCNGKGVGVSLFVQGCSLHCYNCFNPGSWDFDGGKEWTEDARQKFLGLVARPYIKRVSFLGGEPLAQQNTEEVLSLIKEIKNKFPNKAIWLYTGYKYEAIMHRVTTDDLNIERDMWYEQQRNIIELCDVVVDGRYVDSLRDIALPFRGSSNQRIIQKGQ